MMTKILYRSLAIALTLLIPGIVRSQEESAKKAGYIGSFKIGPFGTAHSEFRKDKVLYVLTGRNGGVVQATSELYEISAKQLEIKTASVVLPKLPTETKARTQNKVTDMKAMTSVRIVIRDLAAERKTVLTCDQAVFVATPNELNQGTLRLIGNVISDTTDKTQAIPLHSESESGKIVFLADGNIDVDLGPGIFTGQPLEPTQKPKGKKP